MPKQDKLVGLDLGTTKIACIIAESDEIGKPRIVGVGVSPSHGLKRGMVVNLDKTVESIKRAVEEAERMAGVKIDSCYAGIAGDHIVSMNCKGVVAVSKPTEEITQKDVDRVLDQAKAVALPMDREILHIIPIEYVVDDQPGIKDPVGMCGVRLEAEVHIVTGAVASAQNIYRSIQRAGLKVKDLVLQPLASSYAVLDQDEKELGVVLLDIGGGTTDIAIFKDESIRHSQVIALGGEHITNDIAVGLRTPYNRAEEIKKRYGVGIVSLIEEDQNFKVPGVGGREEKVVSKKMLASIIEPRLEEILTIAHREIKKTKYADLLAAGVVITGGTARLDGVENLAEQIFNLPVKIGIPKELSGLTDVVSNPIHATGVGLVRYAMERRNIELLPPGEGEKLFENLVARMKRWFKEFF